MIKDLEKCVNYNGSTPISFENVQQIELKYLISIKTNDKLSHCFDVRSFLKLKSNSNGYCHPLTREVLNKCQVYKIRKKLLNLKEKEIPDWILDIMPYKINYESDYVKKYNLIRKAYDDKINILNENSPEIQMCILFEMNQNEWMNFLANYNDKLNYIERPIIFICPEEERKRFIVMKFFIKKHNNYFNFNINKKSIPKCILLKISFCLINKLFDDKILSIMFKKKINKINKINLTKYSHRNLFEILIKIPSELLIDMFIN